MIGTVGRLFDALAYNLFGHHLDIDRHERDRARYRALPVGQSFETFLIRQYAIAWLVSLSVGSLTGLVAYDVLTGDTTAGQDILGIANVPDWQVAAGAVLVGTVIGLAVNVLFKRLASAALASLVRRRRVRIERTLPGAVRFLRVVSSATAQPGRLIEAVASRKEIHGATATSFETIRKRAALTGRINAAIRAEARDTPADSSLGPFLLSFVERAQESETALRAFLADESRLLAIEDERRSRRDTRYLRRVIGFFLVLLVGPLVIAVGFVWAGFVIPGVDAPDAALVGPVQTGVLSVLGTGGILFLGGGTALFAVFFRPASRRWAVPAPAQSVANAVRQSGQNPTNALFLAVPIALGVIGGGLIAGLPGHIPLLAGYVALAIPTGLVDLRRARRQARMDAALPVFVHGLADRLDSGRPFRDAVADIADTHTTGPLADPVRKLAADLRLLQGPAGGRKRALERFVGRIGTPFAGRTIGLAIGALEAGADAQSAVEELRTETGRLEHAEAIHRHGFPAVLMIGWTVPMLLVGIVVAVNGMVLETATPTGPVAGVVVEVATTEVTPRPRFYGLTQATMLASGWFAGLTGRGIYEALLHSGVLVTITYLGFRLAGLL